jgi:serine/threonine protein kinase/Flp pilus assembly protein TadD
MTPTRPETDQRIERFEIARMRGEAVDLRDFLPPENDPTYDETLRELVCVDWELAQQQGQSRNLQGYLARFPRLADDPLALALLNRHESPPRPSLAPSLAASHAPSLVGPGDFASRADWREHLARLHEDYRDGRAIPPTLLTEVPAIPPRAAATEESLFGFHLVRLLGRGSFGRVYLAEQPGLASRLVVLKVGRDLFHESQALAELQHTNIMPIYSLHQEGEEQGICMPFLGTVTLADVLRERQKPSGDAALYSTIQRLSHPTEPDAPQGESPRRTAPPEPLQRLDHESAVLWVLARLADGLAHAHERGTVHRDLKPANILLARDGTPLLLDFNLAENRAREGAPSAAQGVGGTIAYMAPEQLRAFRGGPESVDERSDLYALGLIAFELLTGRMPFAPLTSPFPLPLELQLAHLLQARSDGAPLLRSVAPQCSAAVESIVARCLAPDPAGRYQSARELHEDLERQLHHRPLRYAPERSLRERIGKLVRRRPRMLLSGLIAVLLLLAGGLTAMLYWSGLETARIALVNDQATLAESHRVARTYLAMSQGRDREAGERAIERGLAALERLPTGEREAVREVEQELRFLEIRSLRLQALRQGDAAAFKATLREAMQRNLALGSIASEEFSRAVLAQRALLAQMQNDSDAAARWLEQARALPARTSRDNHLLAGEEAAQGRHREAYERMREQTERDPSDAVAWYIRAGCASVLGQPAEAAQAYTVVLALDPKLPFARLWRGQARLAAGEVSGALADLDLAVAQLPDEIDPWVLRGLAWLQQGKPDRAEADFTQALAREQRHTRLFFLRAVARQRQGKGAEAEQDRAEGRKRDPGDALSAVSRGVARLPGDAKGALADFRLALRLDPTCREAAQNAAHVLSEHLAQPRQAIEALDGLLQHWPQDRDALLGRAVLHARQGDAPASLRDVATACEGVGELSGQHLFQVGCVHALLTDRRAESRAEAIRWLERALKAGFGAELLPSDPDLAKVQGDAAFKQLVERSKEKKEK